MGGAIARISAGGKGSIKCQPKSEYKKPGMRNKRSSKEAKKREEKMRDERDRQRKREAILGVEEENFKPNHTSNSRKPRRNDAASTDLIDKLVDN